MKRNLMYVLLVYWTVINIIQMYTHMYIARKHIHPHLHAHNYTYVHII